MWVRFFSALAVLLGFLLPFRFFPDQDFIQGWGVLLALSLASCGFRRLVLGWASLMLFALAGLYLLTALFGYNYLDEWLFPLGALLVMAVYFAGVYGLPLEGRERVLQVVLWAVVVSALISLLLMVVQTLGVRWGGGMLYDLDNPLANVGQRNHLATLLLMALVAAFLLIKSSVLLLSVAGGLVLGLAVLPGRMPLLILFLICLGAWFFLRRNLVTQVMVLRLMLAVLAYVAVTLLFYVTGSVLTGLDRIELGSGSMRLEEVLVAFSIIKDHPFGVGGGYPWLSYLYNIELGSLNQTTWENSHNFILQLVLEFGVFGLFYVLLLMGSLFFLRVRSSWDAMLLLVVMPLVVHAMLEYPLNYPRFLFLLALISVFLIDFKWAYEASRRLLFGASLGVMVFSVFIVFGYAKLFPYYLMGGLNERQARIVEGTMLGLNPALSWWADIATLSYFSIDNGPDWSYRACQAQRVVKRAPGVEYLEYFALTLYVAGDEDGAARVLAGRYRRYPRLGDQYLRSRLTAVYPIEYASHYDRLRGLAVNSDYVPKEYCD